MSPQLQSQRPTAQHTTTDESETEDERVCPECSAPSITDEARGEVVCSDCGLVISEDQVDTGPDWRAYGSQERREKSRVGAPITESRHDKGLTTEIGWQNKDAYGNSLSRAKRRQMNRLRTRHKRAKTKDAGERNLRFALGEIDRMASALGVPDGVREVASVIYRQALNNELLPGRSIEGVATAALYAACRTERIPRSLSDISNVSRIEELQISRTYRYVARELGLEIKPVNPKQHVPRFCSELNAGSDIERKAKEVIDKTTEAGLLSGKSPTGFAAAAIYSASLLCKDKITQHRIADVANVTEVTIRNRYHEQMEELGYPVN